MVDWFWLPNLITDGRHASFVLSRQVADFLSVPSAFTRSPAALSVNSRHELALLGYPDARIASVGLLGHGDRPRLLNVPWATPMIILDAGWLRRGGVKE